MTQRIIVTTDLGYGDSGKGTIADWLVFRQNAEWVVRTGGPQAFHRVRLAGGKNFTFSQFGSGTLRGARTYLSRHMLVHPYALMTEGRALQRGEGISDVFNMLYMSRDCLLITPWHAIANRIKELARGKNTWGTVGIGVGETIRHSVEFPEEACYVRDIGTPGLRNKFQAIRNRILQELEPLFPLVADFPDFSATDIDSMRNPEVIDWALDEFLMMTEHVNVVPDWFFEETVLKSPKPVVCEASQGLLLAPEIGWHPHTTKVDPTSMDIIRDIHDAGYGDSMSRFGILRSYQTRHGKGPFVTEEAEWTKILTDESNSSNHPWQGLFRVGPLDFVALRYAIECVGGPGAFDGLIVTCLDRMKEIPDWKICTEYEFDGIRSEFFETTKSRISTICVDHGAADAHRARQTQLGQMLRNCKPMYTPIENNPSTLVGIIAGLLQIPVVAGSYGATAEDKQVIQTR